MIPVPTGRLVVVAALASVAVLLLPGHPPAGLIAVNALIMVVALADAVAAVDPNRVHIERALPGSLTLGATGTVAWTVTNPTGRRLRIAGADELAPSLHPSARRFGLRLAPHATMVVRAELVPTRRGRFTPGDIVLRVDGPLGLASRQRRRRQVGVLRVLPSFPSRHDSELRIERALAIGIRSAKGKGTGTEFESLRDYAVDDDPRRMDWAATARTGRAIVRMYRAERNQQVVLLLDTGRGMAGRIGGIPRLEHGMDAAMALVSVSSRLGDRCGLIAFDREPRAMVAPAAGSGQLARVVDAIYDLEPRLVESGYRKAFTASLARFRRRSLLVLVTELTEEALSETLFPALPMLLGRHLVIVAAVADPLVAEWAGIGPADVSETFRSAAATQALARRAATVARLRSLGAIVIDAPPGALAAQLVESYLKLKGEGRL